MRTTSSIIIIFAVLAGVAQDAKQEIVKLNKMSVKDPNMAVEIITKVYEDNKAVPIEEYSSKMFRVPGKYLYKTGPMETLANERYKLTVNHYTKQILINKVTRPAPVKDFSDGALFDKKEFTKMLDTLFTLYKSVALTALSENTNEITFVFREGKYETVKVKYDRKTYVIQSMFIKARYDQKNKHDYSCLMVYNYLNKNSLNKKTFSENNYISIKDKKIVPVSALAKYKVIDLSNKKG